MIRVYAVCDRPDLPLLRPLEGVATAGLVAVFARAGETPGEPTPDDLWAHESVVEQLMGERAVLPMRYGTAVPGVDDLRSAITARRDEFAAALDRVRGRVELGLRVVVREPVAAGAQPAPATGRAYLDGRLALDARARAVHQPLAALAAAARRRRLRDRDEVLCAAYLVDSDAVARFRDEVRRLDAEHSELSLLCTGPWPPYSFTTGGS